MATDCKDYDFARVEAHWQKHWDEDKTFRAEDFDPRPKYYILAMYPYPSGDGLHIGHSENYTAPDILARFQWARGHNVLQPMGWDAFGLPTEQTAVATGTHPREVTRRNVATFTRQLKAHGFALDWDREINTTDPGYVRWTQWIFLQLFRHGLAYVDEKPVWWCPALGTVLANEEVIDGRSERGNHPVERRALRQWVLRITAYAEKLLQGLEGLDWPDSTKALQRNWIGRSEGAEATFAIDGHDEVIRIYTTRPDTMFGATYMVLAPEHPLVAKITTSEQEAAVTAYVEAASRKSDLDRTELAKEKSGVFTGAYAINPVNGEKIPIWIADYVLITYGTGAIMAVPAQDERDWEFAEKFDLPILRTVQPPEDWEGKAYTGDGPAINSSFLDGLAISEAKRKMIAWLEAEGHGTGAVNYKLRDWLFSRQRYWGEPFPLLWAPAAAWQAAQASPDSPVGQMLPKEPVTAMIEGELRYALPLPVEALPLGLPEMTSFEPSGSGESALARCPEWVEVWFHPVTGATVPAREGEQDLPAPEPIEGIPFQRARRETNTMPQWAGSCWYYLRYLDPDNAEKIIDPEIERYWQVPDFYTGGQEHAVLHLLYFRFWHQFLHDIGAVTTPEPALKLVHQGMVLAEDGEKMSKSRGNVINPDAVIAEHGADALRTYLMFMGPYEDDKPWNTKGIEGIARFLRRIWRLALDREGQRAENLHDGLEENRDTLRLLHESIRKVTEDLERLRVNTAISQLMILSNHLQKVDSLALDTLRTTLQLLAPIAPHIAEELWARLGGEGTISKAPWPTWDESLLVEETVTIGLLINGKPRGEATVAPDASEESVLALAKEHPKLQSWLDGKTIRKVIYRPGKILNLVVG